MQLHQLKPTRKLKTARRVGRGGKRGTFSGRGSKGQKSRAGTRIRPGFRGGDNPVWKLFPKRRGAAKKTDIKHTRFQLAARKSIAISLTMLEKNYQSGETVSRETLIEKGLMRTTKKGIKILASGKLTKKLVFGEDVALSKSVREQTQ